MNKQFENLKNIVLKNVINYVNNYVINYIVLNYVIYINKSYEFGLNT